ncbi:MAG: hypothetical protein P4M09_14650 [Devosia sp.]|nr:hypothetical protein [Devosia sp.]
MPSYDNCWFAMTTEGAAASHARSGDGPRPPTRDALFDWRSDKEVDSEVQRYHLEYQSELLRQIAHSDED